MATGGEQVKDKKKSPLRARFLMTQANSLELGSSSIGDNEDDSSHRIAETSNNSSSCSRMRRMLFRRSRSETEDRGRRAAKGNETSALAANQQARQTLSPNSSAARNETRATGLARFSFSSLQPRSPPPPYDNNSEASSSRSGSICPPTYDEAVASSASLGTLPEESALLNGSLGGYCSCRECQARSSSPEEEEHEDNCADAVFPMETHVLMQEVLADGMAFCSIM